MNENIDLTKILKDCPNGFELYSTLCGTVLFRGIHNRYSIDEYPVKCECDDGQFMCFTKEGYFFDNYNGAECLLFPSKDQRDWNKFSAHWYKKLIEPKFNVGQYITDGYVVGQITSIEDEYHCYKILDFMGGVSTTITFTLQDNYHLWTIQDAKDGDVLALSWWKDKNLWEKIIIFKKYHSAGVVLYNVPCIEGYGSTFKNGEIAFTDEKVPYYSKTWSCNVNPATKEQRDTLMKAINDAGYEWDVEKKELNKLVHNRFDPNKLKPFDRVLVRFWKTHKWKCDYFSHLTRFDEQGTTHYMVATPYSATYKCCIPYNDETKHLVGTTDEAPEYYRYWED